MNKIVAYRLYNENFNVRFDDKSIYCSDCVIDLDETTLFNAIVLRSENGKRIVAGMIKCGNCDKRILVGHL